MSSPDTRPQMGDEEILSEEILKAMNANPRLSAASMLSSHDAYKGAALAAMSRVRASLPQPTAGSTGEVIGLNDEEIMSLWDNAMDKAASIALNKAQTMALLRDVARAAAISFSRSSTLPTAEVGSLSFDESDTETDPISHTSADMPATISDENGDIICELNVEGTEEDIRRREAIMKRLVARAASTPAQSVLVDVEFGSLIEYLTSNAYRLIETLDPATRHGRFYECSLCDGTDMSRFHYKPERSQVVHTADCSLGKYADALKTLAAPSQPAPVVAKK